MTDHQHLKAESCSGIMHDFHQPRHEIRMQPAILFVQHQKSPMNGLVKHSDGKHAQTNGDHIRHRTALPLHDVFNVPIPFNGKLNTGRAIPEGCFGLEHDWLVKHFLQRLGQR